MLNNEKATSFTSMVRVSGTLEGETEHKVMICQGRKYCWVIKKEVDRIEVSSNILLGKRSSLTIHMKEELARALELEYQLE